jgi:hypothetical protein
MNSALYRDILLPDTTLLAALTTAVVVLWVCWKLWGGRDFWSAEVERLRTETLDFVECEDEDHTPLDKSHSGRIIRLAVAHMRTELGLLNDTTANRMVASEVVRKYMKNHGMRPSHISYQFPTAVEAYFLRSSRDEQLRMMRQSAAYRRYQRTGGAI